MRLTGSRSYTRPILVPKMPPGLVEMMEGLTKDVLKNNPTNVYEFCANHMQKLLEIRDGKSINMPLTLKDKIRNAQEKVRQRAEHRWQKYVLQSGHIDTGLPPNNISRENIKTSIVQPVLQNSLKAPVHHDKELAADFEVEISHELLETVVKNTPHVEKNIDTNIDITNGNLKMDGENTALTNEISDIKSETDIEIEKINKGPEHIFMEENNDSLKNENGNNVPASRVEINRSKTVDGDVENVNNTNETNSALKNENQKEEANSELENVNQNEEINNQLNIENQNEEINNQLNIENQNEEINNDLENDNQSENTIIALRNKNHIEDITNTIQNNNQGKETDGASRNENQNKKISIGLEYENQYLEEEQILQNEILINDDTSILNEIPDKNDPFSNSVDFGLDFADIKPSHREGNEENNHLRFEESERRQSNEVSFEISANESNDNNFQEFSKFELKFDSADKTVDNFQDDAKQNNQCKEDDNIPQSDNFNTSSTNYEETSATSSHRVRRYEKTGDSPKKNCNTGEEDSSTSIILKENNGTSCDKVNESLGNPTLPDNIFFYEDTTKYKKDKFESNEIMNDSKSDGNVGSKVAEESTPDRDITLIKRPVGVEGDSVKDESLGVQYFESTQDEVNDHGNMNLETAAITIQKVFRNFLFKSRAESTFDDTANDDVNISDEDGDNKALIVESEFPLTNSSLNKERRGLGITRMDTVLQTVNEEKSLSLSTDDSSTLSSAATIIQSHVRGFLVRNKLNSYRTVSSNSLVNSNPSLETDTDQLKNKTVLNIHIVPEGSNLSRDESIITSMDLSLDGSPPSSINLHPLGYDKSERRKQLKREDAIQSISPPSNNSGKLSDDSVKDIIINEITIQHIADGNSIAKTEPQGDKENAETSTDNTRVTVETVKNAHDFTEDSSNSPNCYTVIDSKSFSKISSDEMDVVTPFVPIEDKRSSMDINTSKLVHSGEFHDMVLPTKVSRSDTSVVRGE